MTNDLNKAYQQGYADALEETLEMLNEAMQFDKKMIDVINSTINVMHACNLKLTELNKELEEKDKPFTLEAFLNDVFGEKVRFDLVIQGGM